MKYKIFKEDKYILIHLSPHNNIKDKLINLNKLNFILIINY